MTALSVSSFAAHPTLAGAEPIVDVKLALREVAPVILRVCRGILHDGADAEDAAQESLLALARALPAFRGESSIATFATRIAIRTAMRQRSRRRPAPAAEVVREVAPLAELRSVITDLLDRLPHEQAEALALRFVLGHSPAEIAAICGAPTNTVRSRIRLARVALREAVSQHPRLAAEVEVDDE